MENIKNFYGLGIAPAILDILAKLKLTTPTPIQEQSIPIGIDGKDLMGIAQTGTGKTLAFGIPLIQYILNKKGLGLIIAPTRELALQINEALEKICQPLGVRTATLIGGEPIFRQKKAIYRNPSIVIGTPGRIIDHLEQKSIYLDKVNVLVLDEADRMLDMGFAPQLRKINSALPKERQTMLFSATMPEAIINMARSYMKLPVRVEIAPQGTIAKDVTQEVFFIPQEAKPKLLEKILKEYKGSVLIFLRTKHGVSRIVSKVRSMRETVAEIHSDRSLNQRKEALQGFKNGKYRVLVATDIAARGIDVTNIELVINYDLPQMAEDYVHRIGRTGRAGGKGHAISFARPDQKRDVKVIERLIRLTLPVAKLPDLPGVTEAMLTLPRKRIPHVRRFGRRPPWKRSHR
ncbi:MAG: DEAD/DEAH box helicase [Candidatus Colwellbacteria bacterium]|nr:DEAD/DEAH box helicase [Candidatus Colwellbacteria bacterium]